MEEKETDFRHSAFWKTSLKRLQMQQEAGNHVLFHKNTMKNSSILSSHLLYLLTFYNILQQARPARLRVTMLRTHGCLKSFTRDSRLEIMKMPHTNNQNASSMEEATKCPTEKGDQAKSTPHITFKFQKQVLRLLHMVHSHNRNKVISSKASSRSA